MRVGKTPVKAVVMKKKIIFLTLSVLWMVLIFCFSAKTATDSTAQSMFITEKIIRLFIDNPSVELLDFAETFVRKGAHFAEYFVLGGLVFGAVKSFNE